MAREKKKCRMRRRTTKKKKRAQDLDGHWEDSSKRVFTPGIILLIFGRWRGEGWGRGSGERNLRRWSIVGTRRDVHGTAMLFPSRYLVAAWHDGFAGLWHVWSRAERTDLLGRLRGYATTATAYVSEITTASHGGGGAHKC